MEQCTCRIGTVFIQLRKQDMGAAYNHRIATIHRNLGHLLHHQDRMFLITQLPIKVADV
jgi:hypothetical protein